MVGGGRNTAAPWPWKGLHPGAVALKVAVVGTWVAWENASGAAVAAGATVVSAAVTFAVTA